MEKRTIILLGTAGLLAILAISLLLSGPGETQEQGFTTTTISDSMEPGETPTGDEIISSLNEEWTNETDYVEIGEMI